MSWPRSAGAQQRPETADSGVANDGDSDQNQAPDQPDDSDKHAADAHYGEAVRLFGQGRYREAIDEFGRAIELADEPVFYCNRGIAFIKIKEWTDALDDLRTCRRSYEASADELAQIDAQYRGLRASVRVVAPRAAQVAQDIASGQLAPKVVTVNEASDPWNVELLGHLSTGIGAVLLTTAFTLDYLSGDLRDDYITESRGGPGTSASQFRQLRDELQTRQSVFTGLTISGGALVAAGVSILAYSWFFADNRADTPRSTEAVGPASVSVGPTRSGATMQLRVGF